MRSDSRGDKDHVCTYEDIILEKVAFKEKVVIIDDFSDRVALGVAELIAEQGKKVDIITARGSIADPNLGVWSDAPFMLSKIDELGVRITTNSGVKEITESGVNCFYVFSGREFQIEADQVILITTKLSNLEPCHLLRQKGFEVYLIGDARAPRFIWNATHDGYKIGREI